MTNPHSRRGWIAAAAAGTIAVAALSASVTLAIRPAGTDTPAPDVSPCVRALAAADGLMGVSADGIDALGAIADTDSVAVERQLRARIAALAGDSARLELAYTAESLLCRQLGTAQSAA